MGTGTGIGRVRGLGSAKHGSQHWWQQRLTAGSNLLLLVWLVASLFTLPLGDYHGVVLWLSSYWVSVPLVLAVISVFWHLRLGLQVFIEDYVHGFGLIAALVALNFFAVGGAALAIFAILKIAFQGAIA